jgi:hypothetical protein
MPFIVQTFNKKGSGIACKKYGMGNGGGMCGIGGIGGLGEVGWLGGWMWYGIYNVVYHMDCGKVTK